MRSSIVIFRALQLGDMLCAVPALRAIRDGYPRARIVLIGLPWASELVRRYPAYLDGFIDFPGYPGLPEQSPRAGEWRRFLGQVTARPWDLALQLHGSGVISNRIVSAIPARRTVGFGLGGLRYVDEGHEIHRLRRLTDHLGVAWRGDALEFPLTQTDRDDCARLTGTALGAARYACLHPGARSGDHWPVERFARVGAALEERGLRVVVTGTADEAHLARAIARRMGRATVDLTGRTTLGALGACLAGASVLVSNDTGVGHMATALGVPSVLLFAPAQRERWEPLDRARHRVLAPGWDVSPGTVLETIDALGVVPASRPAPAVAPAAATIGSGA